MVPRAHQIIGEAAAPNFSELVPNYAVPNWFQTFKLVPNYKHPAKNNTHRKSGCWRFRTGVFRFPNYN